METFIEKFEQVGLWDINLLVNDLKHLISETGADWEQWSKFNKVTNCKHADNPLVGLSGDVNLTCNPGLTNTLEDHIWSYAGRKFAQSIQVDHTDLHTLNPYLKGTYIEKLYNALVEIIGPIYLRVNNRSNNTGIYLHQDKIVNYLPGNYRYHLPLWTNPGYLIVWTADKLEWQRGVIPEHMTTSYKFNAEYLPATGVFYKLATGYYIHGVSAMGVGHVPASNASRCHIVVCPIKPNDRYYPFTFDGALPII